ncbi:hypothetical protein PG994_009482 [Apiospora phragmitis]|uniref:Uncharacterized protein n=1 Tax=Apiospora phragmitis TaxID=2905665 RepID=A0ABR1UJG3_9PEZI
MTPEQERDIIFLVMMKTNPKLSGGNWNEIAPKVGLGSEIVRLCCVPWAHDNEVHDILFSTCNMDFPPSMHLLSYLYLSMPPAGFFYCLHHTPFPALGLETQQP